MYRILHSNLFDELVQLLQYCNCDKSKSDYPMYSTFCYTQVWTSVEGVDWKGIYVIYTNGNGVPVSHDIIFFYQEVVVVGFFL